MSDLDDTQQQPATAPTPEPASVTTAADERPWYRRGGVRIGGGIAAGVLLMAMGGAIGAAIATSGEEHGDDRLELVADGERGNRGDGDRGDHDGPRGLGEQGDPRIAPGMPGQAPEGGPLPMPPMPGGEGALGDRDGRGWDRDHDGRGHEWGDDDGFEARGDDDGGPAPAMPQAPAA